MGLSKFNRQADKLKCDIVQSMASQRGFQSPPDRPFLVETEWDNPNDRISLWIDGDVTETAVSIPADVVLNRMDIVLRGVDNSTAGFVCVDEYAFDDERLGGIDLPQRSAQVTVVNMPLFTPLIEHELTLEVKNIGNVEDQFALTAVANEPGWLFELETDTTTLLQPNESQFITLKATPPELSQTDIEDRIIIQTVSVPTEKISQEFEFAVNFQFVQIYVPLVNR